MWIRNDVARAKVRSKLDLSDAYEQIRVEPSDVWKTAFATVYGTYVSLTMQIGDCNAPATFQQLMTFIFASLLALFVHAYLDDIFVYSYSIEEHIEHLDQVFNALRKNDLHLTIAKCDLFSEKLDCLGHLIDDKGIHPESDKMEKIRSWKKPQNLKEVQRFLGLVNYLAQFLPNISAYTTPLANIAANGHIWNWRPIHDKCFEQIKAIACKTPILRPIDHRSDEPIWLICDGSQVGIGAMYGQGAHWKTCRPAGFLSKKFTSAQQNYRTFEHETLAILEALLKWEDKLLGHKLRIVTDHEALQFLKTQRKLSARQS